MQRSDVTAIAAANRAAWEASAPLHGTGPGWQALLAKAAQPGFTTFDACLTRTLRGLDLDGRRAVQIGCNNGRELLSLASFGAVPALGIDQSPGFLAQAACLAAAAGVPACWLEADIHALPPGVGRYDFGLITIGVLNWMPDLRLFFAAVAGLLVQDAPLVIYETHPVLEMFDPDAADPMRPVHSYFRRAAHPVTGAITYDGRAATQDTGLAATGYWFQHSLGEIVSAVIEAGFRLDRLEEHPHSNREVEYDIYADQAVQVPMCFTLVARRV